MQGDARQRQRKQRQAVAARNSFGRVLRSKLPSSCNQPQHRLRDAFIDYLSRDRDAYEQCLKARPNGPLAVSYVRGSRNSHVEDRFDFIFVSPEIGVKKCWYDYDGGRAGEKILLTMSGVRREEELHSCSGMLHGFMLIIITFLSTIYTLLFERLRVARWSVWDWILIQ